MVKTLSYDIKAGVTVFLVAIPLCLGIALASNVPATSGLIAGIIGGIVVGLFSGSHVSVSGPAAGLVAVVLGALSTLGSFQLFLTAVILSGVIQIILGYIRAGVIAHYIPYSVIKGMLAAIGLILIFKQIPHAFAHEKLYEGTINFFEKDGSNTVSTFISMFKHFSIGPIIISILSFLALYIFSRPAIKSQAFFKVIPSALIIVIMGALINLILQHFAPSIALEPDELVRIPNFGFDNLGQTFTISHFSGLTNWAVYKYAFVIAIIGSIETLLCIEAADKLDPNKHVTPTGQELKAQGVGNILSGFFGGLPITSVIVRTTTNIESQGKTKLSTIIHGVLLLISLFFAATLINTIPLASLAVLLISVGYKLINEKLVKEMFQKGANQFLPFIVTLLGVFFADILTGVCLGLVVSVFFILKNYYTMQNFDIIEDKPNKRYTFQFPVYTNFFSKASIQNALNKVPNDSTIILDFHEAKLIDPEIHELVKDFKDKALHSNISVEITSSAKIA